jgi:hypothetical protein
MKKPFRSIRTTPRLEPVEDLEDLGDLNAAIERNASKPGIRWEQAKKQLGL